MRMPASAAAFKDPGRNQRALRPPPNSLSWRHCGPKAAGQSRPGPSTVLQLARLLGARSAARFGRLRPLGPGALLSGGLSPQLGARTLRVEAAGAACSAAVGGSGG